MSVLNSFKKRSVIGCFRFLIQLLIKMKFYIKSHVRLYKILCSLEFFLTSISFIRYKVSHGTDLLCVSFNDVSAISKINNVTCVIIMKRIRVYCSIFVGAIGVFFK